MFFPSLFLSRKRFFMPKCTLFLIAKVFVAKFAGKASSTKVYAFNFANFSYCETFCPKSSLHVGFLSCNIDSADDSAYLKIATSLVHFLKRDLDQVPKSSKSVKEAKA